MTRATRHLVLIGAARSGTKILRDALAEASGVGCVPYDIGYVWRAERPTCAHDVLDPDTLTAGHRKFVARFVDRYASGQPACVIEKTVGNALRVPYVARVLPDAVFVHLVRDGVDVTESTYRQWRQPADFRYLWAKARHFPPRLVPSYGRRYAISVLRHLRSDDGRVATWGPRYPGMDEDLGREGLLTVCARQWRTCVERASADLQAVGAPTVEVRYEDLVADPVRELTKIIDVCELDTSRAAVASAGDKVSSGRTGVGAGALRNDQLRQLDSEIGDLLDELGYARPSYSERGEQ